MVLFWAPLTTCISSVTMVGFSNWAMKAMTYRILSFAQVITVSQVQALLLVCTMSKVHTATISCFYPAPLLHASISRTSILS